MNKSSPEILNTPLEKLCLSNEFISFCEAHDLIYLSELIAIGTRKLDNKSGFTKRMLFEYLQLLERHGLDDFMET